MLLYMLRASRSLLRQVLLGSSPESCPDEHGETVRNKFSGGNPNEWNKECFEQFSVNFRDEISIIIY